MSNKTESMNELFQRLESIKNQLNTNTPDLDNLMPLYDEANEIVDKLSDFFDKTQKTIEDKQKKRNNSK